MKESIKKITPLIIIIVFIALLLFASERSLLKTKDRNNQETLNEIEEYSYINERVSALVILMIISVALLIISFIINKKIKTNNYRRETSGLVSPILAEAIIDGKIGLKELIMTTIIELNIRGNINIINNDTLELVSVNNLEKYEKDIVDILFKNGTLRFSDINDIFANSNKDTLEFAKNMSQVNLSILDKLRSMNIFSKGLSILNKAIGLFAVFIIINLPSILAPSYSNISACNFCLSICVCIYYIKTTIHKSTVRMEIIKNLNKPNKSNTMLMAICGLSIILFALVPVAKYHIIFFIFTLLAFALNIYIAFQSQKIILTNSGKTEQAKLKELKNYIIDYSLIEDRGLESVVIWDKYLAYATAFGLPNNVTNNIYEKWYNLNLNLQVIAKMSDF